MCPLLPVVRLHAGTPTQTRAQRHLLLSSLQLLNQIFPLMGCKVPHANFFISEPLFSNCHPQQLWFPWSEKGKGREKEYEKAHSPRPKSQGPISRKKFLEELLQELLEESTGQATHQYYEVLRKSNLVTHMCTHLV